ncbi:Ribosomal protein S13 [Heracleum sosnowskyi]|uniref:Ribosomal protein S13 n=1 Tax=Heracleum sosnowskyi TaxID=360622 RepID=A0AAD8HMN1_9APIA|nr:Ribosomal protein S13 [Heracleum sosnowskyi]
MTGKAVKLPAPVWSDRLAALSKRRLGTDMMIGLVSKLAESWNIKSGSAQRLMKSRQLVRSRFWLAPFYVISKIGLEPYTIQGAARADIERFISISCYRGIRHQDGLPLRGQPRSRKSLLQLGALAVMNTEVKRASHTRKVPHIVTDPS